MSTNPTSFRLPPLLTGLAHPQVVETIENHDQAINDLQQANQTNSNEISKFKASATASSSTTVEQVSTETIVEPGTVSSGAVNNQTGVTAYTSLQSDNGGLVVLDDSSAIAVTLTTSLTIPYYVTYSNQGPGAATFTPTTGQINGASTFTLAGSSFVTLFLDGTNWWADTPPGGGGGSGGLPTNNPTFTGILTGPHYAGNGSAPTIVVGTAAGSGASASISGTDSCGQIQIVTGLGTTTGIMATVTFSVAYGGTPIVIISPANGAAIEAGAVPTQVSAQATGTGGFTLTADPNATQVSTNYMAWNYWVIG